ncbi:MAG: hypothetical protein ACI9RM_001754 [Ulvibacter sp.]|jgi:hypothetical protein
MALLHEEKKRWVKFRNFELRQTIKQTLTHGKGNIKRS